MEPITAPDTMTQQRAEMAAILGLDQPVSEQVLKAAVNDEMYAHNLLVCRGEPGFMQHLLENPPVPAADSAAPAIGTTTLLRRAAESLTRWAKTGFSTVSEDIYQKRLAACDGCPHLTAPPAGYQQTLYALAGAPQTRSVCGQCGCIVAVKARRSSDTCPDAHPIAAGLNRWDEPFSATDR